MSQQQKTAVVQSVCLNLIQRTRRVGGASLGHLTSLLRETQSAAPCVQQRCKQQAQSLASGSQARKATRAGRKQSACAPVAALAACEDDAERQQHLKRKEEAADAPEPRSHGALGASGARNRTLTFTAVAETCLRRSEAPAGQTGRVQCAMSRVHKTLDSVIA